VIREFNKNIYWNLIWYFAEYNLPYDFMVPYSGEEQLWEEFIHANDHLVVRNKTRFDQMLREDGGSERALLYLEEKLKIAEKKEAAELMKKKPLPLHHSITYQQFGTAEAISESWNSSEKRKGKKVKKVKKSESSHYSNTMATDNPLNL
jgi:hypothetical protein